MVGLLGEINTDTELFLHIPGKYFSFHKCNKILHIKKKSSVHKHTIFYTILYHYNDKEQISMGS